MFVSAVLVLALTAICEAEIHHQAKLPVFVSITTWVGDIGIEKTNDVFLFAPNNSSLYDVMRNAAKIDPKHFSFEATEHPEFGHYVTEIGGVKEDLENKHHWMVYQLKEKPSTSHPPSNEQLATVGVDLIRVHSKDHFLWWYKKGRQ